MTSFFKVLTSILMLCGSLNAYADDKLEQSHYVVVSVAPYRFFVNAIAGDSVEVGVFVPPGTSFHDYEPTPKQVLTTGKADIWFRIGESFETRAIQAIQGHALPVKIVDLRDGVSLITAAQNGHGCAHCLRSGADLHIWLSVKEAKIQANKIAETLIATYPENTQLYQSNLRVLQEKLDALDAYVGQALANVTQRTIMVGHPAYAYFARDYKLTQLSVEFEGKDPTPRQLVRILEDACKNKINTIFIQKQYSSKAVNLVAKELKAQVVCLDPYSEQYFEMMRAIADAIAKAQRPYSGAGGGSSAAFSTSALR